MPDYYPAPAAHPDPWVNVLRGYVTRTVESLATTGLLIERSWLDPRDPRDATIIFSDPAANVSAEKLALVWDEVSGWRHGTFVGGEQGVRTEMANVTYLGGGVLPSEDDVANRVLAGASEMRHVYRSATDTGDGLDTSLLDRC
jgi:hypothetical protein